MDISGRCHLSAIPVRGESSHRSEMVTQLLYNENYTILEEQEEWTKIQCQHDGYQGWIAQNQVQLISKEEFDVKPIGFQTNLMLYNTAKPLATFAGSPVYLLNPLIPIEEMNLLALAKKFINTPYLWGGRSPFGIDCSGLMQVIFRTQGTMLPRDAYQQAEVGISINWGDHQVGDLAFFENAKGKITHVGLISGKQSILHASAWVREDTLSEEGIFHQGEKTHQLCLIKRI